MEFNNKRSVWHRPSMLYTYKKQIAMKSKLLILSLLLSGVTTLADAQTKEKYYSESWKDNWFMSIGVGMQGGTNPDSKFGKSISPLINLSVGKNITPLWGLRGQIYGWQSKQETAFPFLATGNPVSRKENYVGFNADAMLNLSTLVCGYNPDRVFELLAFVGPSVNIVKNYGAWQYVDANTLTPVRHNLRWLVGGSVGLGAKFNVNKHFAIDVEARGQVTPSILGACSSAKTDGYVHLTLGGTYTFGGKKFVTCSPKVDQNAVNNEINRYRDELAKAKADLDACQKAKANVQPEVKEVTKEILVSGLRPIFFSIGSDKIDDYGMVNIQLAAKFIKSNPGKTYKIAGYCDKATGSAEFNQKLSERRAQAVYDALVAEGVDKNQLQLEGFGGTANMFGKDSLNRVVILE